MNGGGYLYDLDPTSGEYLRRESSQSTTMFCLAECVELAARDVEAHRKAHGDNVVDAREVMRRLMQAIEASEPSGIWDSHGRKVVE